MTDSSALSLASPRFRSVVCDEGAVTPHPEGPPLGLRGTRVLCTDCNGHPRSPRCFDRDPSPYDSMSRTCRLVCDRGVAGPPFGDRWGQKHI